MASHLLVSRPGRMGSLLLVLVLGFCSASRAQVLGSNLIYTSIQPCRVFDTRFATNGTNGQLAANVAQTFNVVGGNVTSTYFTGQGGNNGGCSIPGFASFGAQVQAVVFNLTVVTPFGTGVLQAWPTDQGKPMASVLNFTAAELVLANAIVLPVRQDAEGADITVESNVKTHVLADVVGYFSSLSPEGSNIAVGGSALSNLTTGSGNTAVGDQAMSANTTGSANVALGFNALAANQSGANNIAIGWQAMLNNTSGLNNVAVGQGALGGNTSGGSNVAVGFQALAQNMSGSSSTAVGAGALGANTNGSSDTAVGASALNANTNGTANTALGSSALSANQGGSDNTALGASTLSANISGSNNTAVGAFALGATTGNGNTAVGIGALGNVTSGSSNVAMGANAGSNILTGALNIYIGGGTSGDESSTIRIGANQSAAFIAGISGETSSGGIDVLVNAFGKLGTTTSSLRFKDEVADMGDASSGLMKLRPVTFRYKPAQDDGSHLLQYGLIAEEVAQVYPGLVQVGADGQPSAVRYHFVNAMLLNEVQKQHARIAAQASEIAAQRARIEDLEARIARLEEAASRPR